MVTEDDGFFQHLLTRAALLKGLGRWVITHGPKGVIDPTTGITDFDIDAGASDAIMQFALFGEQKYG